MHKFVTKHFSEIVLEINVRTRTGAFKKNPRFTEALALLGRGRGVNNNSLVESFVRSHMEVICVRLAKAEKAEAVSSMELHEALVRYWGSLAFNQSASQSTPLQ